VAAEIPAELVASYERLLVEDVRRRLPGIALEQFEPLPTREVAELLSVASHLALSEGHGERDVAYEIATRTAALAGSDYPGLVRGAELILARLGNFPGRDLLRQRFAEIPSECALLQLEMRVHEIDNTINDAGGTSRRLTDFQFDMLRAFSAHRSVSVSAPTSAGKSFVLSLEVLRKLREQRPAGIVYVVPTRALIRQVVVDLRRVVSAANLPSPLIRSVPRAVVREQAPAGIIYVLTQERLLSLLNAEDGEPWITALIVDEAQSIGDGARGVLLHTAIDTVRIQFPDAEVIFASPLAKNPEYLLDRFQCVDAFSHQEEHSPVSQNRILVDSVPSSPRRIQCSLLAAGAGRLDLGQRDIPFLFRGLSALRRLALFARSLDQPDDPESCCIIYANGARDAERTAHHLVRGAKPVDLLDQDVEDFIAYLNEFVHPKYGLSEMLRYGVAFHYSNMPGSVRAGVEDLFQRRKLRFLCCTSTLLQGVNLPARHIVIEAPTRGRNKPMERADFLNLAGRAGRLTREFHGNVWCLWPNRWTQPSFEGEPLQEIRSAFDRVLEDGGTAIRQAFDDDEHAEDGGTAVAALGRVFTEFIQKERPFDIQYHETPENSESLKATLALLEDLGKEVRLPTSIFARNSGVHPRRLEALYAFFGTQTDLVPFCPIRPNTKGTNQRLREIFQRVQRLLGGVENDSYTQHAKIASAWIHEAPLSRIIANELAYRESEAKRASPPTKVNVRNLIYGIIDTMERELRFRYVKYLRAYNDALAQALKDRGEKEWAEQLPPFHLYLESGAFRPVPINLMSLGLTRVTALLLAKRIVLPSDATPEECLRRCREAIANAPQLALSPTVRREIALLSGE
jgi:hypothetical protein